ncbi:hypothetical protein C491_05711 [Natronococcus amylolyticus DSM 10524]|uniref:Uncharacterized protein n=1 Tax=Natronococcus amylolyticus DSM 10524 TaxID=1227497 RepID=L9XDN0_9EURY|nr:hypothetical protein [Natronococcus amylolyticus]ELY59840.1 hypothetical protein C491_05711 [Natronococcus amylolyticus DSM 10524]
MTTDRHTDANPAAGADELPTVIADAIREFAGGRAAGPGGSSGLPAPVDPADQLSDLGGRAPRLEEAVPLSEPISGVVLLCSVDSLSAPSRSGSAVHSRSAFATSAQRLVSEACRNGVDVRGSWSLRTEETFPDFELEVLEVEKPVRSDDSSSATRE